MPELEYRDGIPVYRPDGKILSEYLYDNSKVAVIWGPIGSGTSSCSMMRMLRHAMEQNKDPKDGVRRSRWAIIRETYDTLERNVLPTYYKWFPESVYGRVIASRPMYHVLKLPGAQVEIEIWFLALDGNDDSKKLRSSEYTGIFINEGQNQTLEIFTEARSRTLGRYPAVSDGGSQWSGVIMDMNAAPEDHFIARMNGLAPYPDDVPESKRLQWPAHWFFRRQPPGLIEVMGADGVTVTGYKRNPEAENQKWLDPDYYTELAIGSDPRWINAIIMARPTFLASGDPVWPGFKEAYHVSKTPLEYVPGRRIVVPEDFGRRPCALVAQEIGDKIHVLEEIRRYNMGAAEFAPILKRHLEQNYRGATIEFTGDPKGADKSQVSDKSAFDIHAGHGMRIIPARTRGHVNNINERLEAVSYALLTNRILIDFKKCPTLHAALAGKYCWRKLELGEAEPVKDRFSDVADCLQYLCLFLGEGRRMIGLEAVQLPVARKIYRPQKSLRRVKS